MFKICQGARADSRLFLQAPLQAFTEQTITSVKELRTELERVEVEGWASSLGELEDGFNGVAVPILDALGCYRASLSVSGPVYLVPPARLPEIALSCKKAAGEISASLGKTRSLAWNKWGRCARFASGRRVKGVRMCPAVPRLL